MDITPKTENKARLTIRKTGRSSPYHSTPETNSYKKAPDSSEQFSPINSPSRYDQLSQDIPIRWGWKSPGEFTHKKTGLKTKAAPKTDVTPKTNYTNKYLSPKPKRKAKCQNYSDKLRSLADEFKSLTEGMASSTLPDKAPPDENSHPSNSCVDKSGSAVLHHSASKSGGSVSCGLIEPQQLSVEENFDEEASQDILVVELTDGDLNSLKSFPPDHQFPIVPKLDLDTNMNCSEQIVLIEDSSIEGEMLRCTQKIEEEFICQNKMEKKMIPGPQRENNNVPITLDKLTDFIKSPNTISSTSKFPGSPALNRRNLSLKNFAFSPQKRPGVKSLAKSNDVVSWDSSCNKVKAQKLEPSAEEDVMGMLADDSFDNIMLELVVQNEPSKQAITCHPNKASVCGVVTAERVADHSLKVEKLESDSKLGDSLGMLEDDSLNQPDVLNFLDTVESHAIAVSQPLKCTPEEIQMKLMEAKKKLAVGKRKRRSQMSTNGVNPSISVTSSGKINR